MWGSVRLRYLAHFNTEILAMWGAFSDICTNVSGSFLSVHPKVRGPTCGSESWQDLKVWKPGALMERRKKRWMPQLVAWPTVPFLQGFCCGHPIQVGWADAHPHGWGQPIQMLISSGNSLVDIPRNKALLAVWMSLNPMKLMQKCHRNECLHIFFLKSKECC